MYFIVRIIGAIYRQYDCKQRKFNDSKPERQSAKNSNDRNNKLRNRQRQVQLYIFESTAN